MGRLFVVFLATAMMMALLLAFFPGMYSTAFTLPLAGGIGIKWGILVGLGCFYTGHRMTSK